MCASARFVRPGSLRAYQVNHLKISQSFVDASLANEDRAKAVRAIVNLARELDIDVITQGVETAQQRDRSSETSIIAQGVFFSDALDASSVAKLLEAGRSHPAGEDDPGGKVSGPIAAGGRK